MKSNLASLASELAGLDEADFDEDRPGADGIERLAVVCDRFRAAHKVEDVAPLLLSLVERLPRAYLGSPGHLVHTLESMRGYEPYLRESLHRKPTSLTLWMVNRIANAHRSDMSEWVEILKGIARNRLISSDLREEADHFARLHHEA